MCVQGWGWGVMGWLPACLAPQTPGGNRGFQTWGIRYRDWGAVTRCVRYNPGCSRRYSLAYPSDGPSLWHRPDGSRDALRTCQVGERICVCSRANTPGYLLLERVRTFANFRSMPTTAPTEE
eukprot:407748-Prorocentrum_minimum.AAC.2